jgi:lipoyl synthase
MLKFYNNMKTNEEMESPEYIKLSLAAAMSLNLENGSFKDGVKLTGLNLLLTYNNGCLGKCAYCGIPDSLAKKNMDSPEAGKDKKTFIRVKWPTYKLDDVIEAAIIRESNFERICISMITHRNAVEDTKFITKKISHQLNLPISLLIAPTLINNPGTLKELKDCGAEMVGIAIDGANEQIFEKYRGKNIGGPHSWEKYWEVLKWSTDVFGIFKTGIHLMIGLGETEKDAVNIIQRAYGLGSKTHLFSFYPEPGSLLVNSNPPELLSYRKIQIARYLINEQNYEHGNIEFDSSGKISSFANCDLEKIIEDGFAFMTSGCPCRNSSISACNRPFANERPSDVFRNYPYLPGKKDKKLIRKQLEVLL